MSRSTVLVVDDELSIRESFGLILSDKYRLLLAASGEAAVKYCVDEPVELVYLDIRMPGLDGLETLRKIREVRPQTMVIMVTAVNDVQKAAEAVKFGAYDYVVKPFDVKQIQDTTTSILARRGITREAQRIAFRGEEVNLIGSSRPIEQARAMVEEARNKEGGVLVLGEGGVEKEWVARSCLAPGQEFVKVDLNTLAPGRLMKTLFGEKRGGSVTELSRMIGKLEEIEQGVIFLDNIDRLPAKLQEKLAGFGYSSRLVCGSTFNLKELGFNRELLDKISETIIELPPLRERSEDLPLLLDHFLERFNQKYARNLKGLSTRAKELLSSYPFPGNVLELEFIVERLVLTVEGPLLEPEDLPLNVLFHPQISYTKPMEEIYAEFEKDFIREVLARCGQDKNRAAQRLGLKPSVLDSKLS
jgi:DNA-binding NtrC family response regulator